MDYKLLANFVLAFHVVWVVILLGGIFVSVNYERYRPIQLAVVTTTVVSQMIFLGCPLVTLESVLRRQYDPSTSYSGSFVVHYLQKFGVEVSPLMVTLALAIVATASFAIWVLPELRKKGGATNPKLVRTRT